MSTTVSSPPPFPPAFPATPRTSGVAIASLVLGILAPFTVITSIPAVITGHIALGAVKRSGGLLVGRGMAIAGLVLGYLGFAVILLAMLAGLVAPLVIRQREKADQSATMQRMREIHLAVYEWSDEQGGSFPRNEHEFRESLRSLSGPERALAVRRDSSEGWKYFPSAMDAADPLLISPPIDRGRKILILRVDGSVKTEPNLPENIPAASITIPAARR